MKLLLPYSEYRSAARVAWPLIVSHASFTVMLFFDRLFLARYSTVAIQAALPAGIFSFTLVCGFMSVASYTNTFVAQFHGAGNRTGCSRATAQGLLFSVCCAPVLLLLIPVGRWVLRHAGHAPEVLAAELPYFTILMLGSIATPLNAAVSSFFTGQGRTRLTMWVMVLGNAINLLLDYGLIFGRLGLPEMGIRGAAWATLISGWISPVILLGLYFSRRENRDFRTRSTLRYEHRLFWRMIRFSLPAGVHLFLDIASFSAFVLLTGRMGAVALSASNVALSINTLAFMPLIGFGIAASILVGQHQGRQDASGAARAAHACAHIGLFYMGLISLLFLTQPDFLVGLFIRPDGDVTYAEVFPIARRLLIILTLWGLADVCNMVYANALKGAGDTRFVMLYSVVLAWGMLVLGQCVIILWLRWSIVAAWSWTGLYVGCLGTGFVARFLSGRWKNIRVIEHC